MLKRDRQRWIAAIGLAVYNRTWSIQDKPVRAWDECVSYLTINGIGFSIRNLYNNYMSIWINYFTLSKCSLTHSIFPIFSCWHPSHVCGYGRPNSSLCHMSINIYVDHVRILVQTFYLALWIIDCIFFKLIKMLQRFYVWLSETKKNMYI